MSGHARRAVTVGYFAAVADAAGCTSETVETDAATLGELAAEVSRRHGARMAELVRISSFLVGDEVVRDPATPLDGIDSVDVLPPFAGG